MLSSKHVVLVSDQDEVIGSADKLTVHNTNTPLHRGFSVFLFNSDRRCLLQKRHSSKKTWPGFWSNSFCGHPQLEESYEQAAIRHAEFELGITLTELSLVSNYSYKFKYNDIVENEICPIYFATSDQRIIPNFKEISETQWIKWEDFLLYIKAKSQIFTPWCIEEAAIMNKSDILTEYISYIAP